MKKIFTLFTLIFTLTLVGCAKTPTTDTFRFQVRELTLTIGEEKELDLILGSFDKASVLVTEQVNAEEGISGEVEVLSAENGKVKVKASKVGEVVFRVSLKDSPNVKDTITIIVEHPKTDYIEITSDKMKEDGKIEVIIKETAQINVKTNPVIEGAKFIYESSDEKVFKIDENGVITGVGRGIAKVKVYEQNDSSFYSEKDITVNYAQTKVIKFYKDKEKTIETDEITMKLGEEYEIYATAFAEDGSTDTVDQNFTGNTTKPGLNLRNGKLVATRATTFTFSLFSGTTSIKITVNVVSE